MRYLTVILANVNIAYSERTLKIYTFCTANKEVLLEKITTIPIAKNVVNNSHRNINIKTGESYHEAN